MSHDSLVDEAKSQTLINYEVFLPIIFALVFMILLFIIYVLKNVDIRGALRRRRRQMCCCFWKKKKNVKLNTATSGANATTPFNKNCQDFMPPTMPNMNNYAKTIEFLNGKNYVAEMQHEYNVNEMNARSINNIRRSQNIYAHLPMPMPSHQKFINSHNFQYQLQQQQQQNGLGKRKKFFSLFSNHEFYTGF